MALIAALRDNFTDNAIAPAWTSSVLGSGTVAETSGQLRMTLPSSTAGSHLARLTSTSAYDLTAGSFYVNIDTMVATGVAATAFFQLFLNNGNGLQWIQLSGTLQAYSLIGGVQTSLYSVAWNASTYKYLRIRNSGANILWESSTNALSWTTRATLATPFAITALYVDVGASCGNIAAPGSFRLEDVNLILPALTTNWRWQQVIWPLTYRYKSVTIALDTAGTAQGYLVTADGMDVSGAPSGNVRYWSGPADGGRLLTEQTSQATAEAAAVDLPVDGRFDLPTMVEARCVRLYDRSIDGAAFTLREFYPRRLVQADDIEAESIRALHIASASITGDRIVAGTITADLITVTELSAITADMGTLTAGSITGGTIDGAIIYAGSGNEVTLDNNGIGIIGDSFSFDLSNISPVVVPREHMIQWSETTASQAASIAGSLDGQLLGLGDRITLAVPISSTLSYGLDIDNDSATLLSDTVSLGYDGLGTTLTITSNVVAQSSTTTLRGALNVGSATGAGGGDVSASGGLNIGSATGAPNGGIKATTQDAGTTNTSPSLYLGHNTSGTPGVNFGADIVVTLETTTTPDTLASIIRTGWDTATHVSRKGHVQHYVYDTAPRLALEIAASGSAAMLGVLGAAPVVRQSVAAAAAAGGTGATAGAYDTAAHRDALITLVNNMRTAGINLGFWS